MTGSEPSFTVEVDQNTYLHEGATEVDAVVTVTATGAPTVAAAGALEVLVVDTSGSMQGQRIRSARQATVAALAELRDGVAFAVISGSGTATQIYPGRGGTAVADARTRAEATAQVNDLTAVGGTAVGAWLTAAGELAKAHPAAAPRHAILLTDGKNGEQRRVFQAALDGVRGLFTCDCRGVGTDWRVEELRAVSDALLGTVDIVADPADLAADFRAIMESSMGKNTADVALRLWTPRGASVRFVKQVAPTVADLTGRRTEAGPQRGDYPLGSWGAESRDYHVGVAVNAGTVGDEMLAGRVQLVRSGSADVLGQGLVKAVWTDDTSLSSRISRGVAHYTGQAELAEAIQEGLAARKAGDEPTATARLGRAVALAHESGNDNTARLLEKVVDVLDAPSGTIRLRKNVADVDEMTLDTRSTRTARFRGGS